MSLEKLQKNLQIYREYLKLSELLDFNHEAFSEIKKELKANDIKCLKDSLRLRIDKIERIFFYKKCLEKIVYPSFLKALNTLNKSELEKFAQNTKHFLASKCVKTKSIKKHLAYDFKYVLKDSAYLQDLKNLLVLI